MLSGMQWRRVHADVQQHRRLLWVRLQQRVQFNVFQRSPLHWVVRQRMLAQLFEHLDVRIHLRGRLLCIVLQRPHVRNRCWQEQPHLVHERVSLHGHLRGRMPRLLQQRFELQRNLPGKRGPDPVFRRNAGLRGLLGDWEPSHAWTTVF